MNSYSEGYEQGYNKGFSDGKTQKDANDTFDGSIYDEDFSAGYKDGYEEGFENGYDTYINDLNKVTSAKRKNTDDSCQCQSAKKKTKEIGENNAKRKNTAAPYPAKKPKTQSSRPPIPKIRIIPMGSLPGGDEDGGTDNGIMDFFKMLSGLAPATPAAPPPPPPPEDLSKYEYRHVGECNNLNDLIRIGEEVKASPVKYRYNIDTNKLVNALDAIKKFNAMIGLKDIKQTIFTKIMYHLHGLHDPINGKGTNHCCITGVPGVGKSELIHRLAEIFAKIGAVTKGQIVTVKIYDLISEHIGGTAVQTREILKKATGGILVIDEAYSIGNSEGKNTFNEEAITLIMAWLTEEAATSACYISGYGDQIKSRLYSVNPGLESRFSTTLNITGYNASELKEIFMKLVKDAKWTADDIDIQFFQSNMQHFPAFGRDMENLFNTSKEAHSRRLTTIVDEATLLTTKKKLSVIDLQNGLLHKISNGPAVESTKHLTMYT